jgi:hypothetical protein
MIGREHPAQRLPVQSPYVRVFVDVYTVVPVDEIVLKGREMDKKD